VKLQGRAALITGASAGIGRATALTLAREGAAVFATGRRQKELDALAGEIAKHGGKATAIAGDLDDGAFVRRLCEQAGAADILVNNAGILIYAPVLDITPEQCEAMLRTNVVAAFAVAREMGRRMVERKRGHQVFITSGAARNVNQFGVVYAATKHALSAFAKGFRLELKGAGIKVSEVAPGMVDTEMRAGITHPEVLKSLAARKFKPISAQDVADAVLFALTASENSSPDLIEVRPKDA
jgi:3-hydroxy acid dehydrogenase/malonic semialdehyde reductase